jgi:hypothetical protein
MNIRIYICGLTALLQNFYRKTKVEGSILFSIAQCFKNKLLASLHLTA